MSASTGEHRLRCSRPHGRIVWWWFSKFYLPDGSQVLFQGQVARRAGLRLPGGTRVNYDSNAGGLLDYAHADHLGSFRLFTTPARAFSSSQAYAPFGEPYAVSSISADQAFTGQNSNFALDLYVFPGRQYSDEGRWTSPDPAGLSAVDPADPQSWNRYAYVENSPLIYTDPTGMNKVDCTVNGAPSICNGLGGGAGGGGSGGIPIFGNGFQVTGVDPDTGLPYGFWTSTIIGYDGWPSGGSGGGGAAVPGQSQSRPVWFRD